MRGVAGQQQPPGSIAGSLKGRVAVSSEPARGVHAEVGTGNSPHACPQLCERRLLRACVRHADRVERRYSKEAFAEPHHEHCPGVAVQRDRRDVRWLAYLNVSHDAVERRGTPDKLDLCALADRTGAALTADYILSSESCRASSSLNRDRNALVVLAGADHAVLAPHRHSEGDRMLLEQFLGSELWEEERERVARVE